MKKIWKNLILTSAALLAFIKNTGCVPKNINYESQINNNCPPVVEISSTPDFVNAFNRCVQGYVSEVYAAFRDQSVSAHPKDKDPAKQQKLMEITHEYEGKIKEYSDFGVRTGILTEPINAKEIIEKAYLGALKLTPFEKEILYYLSSIHPVAGPFVNAADLVSSLMTGRNVLGEEMTPSEVGLSAIGVVFDAGFYGSFEQMIRSKGVFAFIDGMGFYNLRGASKTGMVEKIVVNGTHISKEEIEFVDFYKGIGQIIEDPNTMHIVEVGPGTSLANTRHLNSYNNGKQLVFFGVEASYERARVDPSQIGSYLNDNYPNALVTLLGNFEGANKVDVLRFAFPYRSGLSMALDPRVNKVDSIELLIGGDSLLDIAAANIAPKEFEKYFSRNFKEITGLSDFDSYLKFLGENRQAIKSGKPYSQEYLILRQRLIEGMGQYYEELGYKVEIQRILTPKEIQQVGTNWAIRSLSVNDPVIYLFLKPSR